MELVCYISLYGNISSGTVLAESNAYHPSSCALSAIPAWIVSARSLAVTKNKKATKKSWNEALKHLKQSIGPLLDVAADLFRKSAHTVAPIAGGEYAHRRMRVSKMKELNIPTKPNPESSLLLVDKFLQQHKPATAMPVHVHSSKRIRNGNLIYGLSR